MLILRSILFSFSILWRMVLVMPFVAVALAVFGGMLAIWLVTAALFFPSIFFLAGTVLIYFPQVAFLGTMAAVFATMSVVPMMIGSRLGLQAKGMETRHGYAAMILPALGYGLFEGLVGILLFSCGFGLFMLLSPLTLADLGALAETGSSVGIEQAFADNSALIWIILVCIGLTIMALRAAILVPLAGAAIGQDPNGTAHTPFMGFGTRYPSLLIVVLLAYIISAFAGPLVLSVAYLIGVGDTFTAALTSGDETSGFFGPILGWQIALLVGVMVVFNLWIFSLQCAAGTLGYLRNKAVYEALKSEEATVNRMDPAEVRELWKSRMPPGNK